jgi:hypothetical protein
MVSLEALRKGGAVTIEAKARSGGHAGSAAAQTLNLHVGEWVEVLTPAEIMRTLDEHQALDGLPFMPEMLPYCGKRYRVYKSAHKTCDTIDKYVIRRMEATVHLEGLRCDGAGHGGCEAACLIFWKEAWLKRADGPATAVTQAPVVPEPVATALAAAARRPTPEGETGDYYRCQTTEVLNASTEVTRRQRWDPRFYLKDLTTGNIRLTTFVKYGLFAVVNAFSIRWFGRRYPYIKGQAGTKTPRTDLNLKSGDLVEVRSRDEIIQTLNAGLRNRGLWFDVEQLAFCGHRFRVLRKVEKILNEKTGRMMKMPNPCVILEGATCSGNISTCRMFCPRAVYPFWHEVWLKRVDAGDAQ